MIGDTKTCEACGAKFEFIEGPNGKMIPAQKVRVVYGVTLEPPFGQQKLYRADMPNEVQLYISHFETCPQADRFSGGRARG